MGGNPVSGSFYVSALHKSFDSRQAVSLLTERDAIAGAFRFKGMVCYVKETDKHYEFNFSEPETAGAYADNANWKEVDFHKHDNFSAIIEVGMDNDGKPTWAGAAWPAGTSVPNLTDIIKISTDVSGVPLWNGQPWPSTISIPNLDSLQRITIDQNGAPLIDGQPWPDNDLVIPNLSTLTQIGVDALGNPTWNGQPWPDVDLPPIANEADLLKIGTAGNGGPTWNGQQWPTAGTMQVATAAELQTIVVPAGVTYFASDINKFFVGDGVTLGGIYTMTGSSINSIDGGSYSGITTLTSIDGGAL